MTVERPCVVCVSTMGWDFLWTRKQRFMRHLGSLGWHVLYVEPPESVLAPLLQREKMAGRGVGRRLRKDVVPGVDVLTPALGPPGAGGTLSALQDLRYDLLYRDVSRAMSRLGMERPVHWTYTVESAPHAGRLGERSLVYDCVDLVTHYPGVEPVRAAALEERLCTSADLVLVTAKGLVDHVRPVSRRVEMVPNGFDPVLLGDPSESDTAAVRERIGAALAGRPLVSFVGGVYEWIDLEAIRVVAERNPGVAVIVAGPVGKRVDLSGLEAMRNVAVLGRLGAGEVHALLALSAVCLNPFVAGGLAEHVSPLKVYEYLAVGRPVVSTPMPEIEALGEVVRFASGPEGFAEAVGEALTESAGDAVERRREAVAGHSWERLCARMVDILEDSGVAASG